jgi:hypothetical protein
MNEQLKQCAKAAFMLASAPFAFTESVAFADIQFKDIRLEINARSSGDVLFPPPVFDSMGFTMYGNEGQDTFLIENEAKDFLMMREDSTYSFLIENEAFVSFLIENEAKFVNPFQFKRLLDHIISHRKQDMIEEAREFLIRNKQLTLLALQNTLTTLMALQNTLTLVFSVAEINPISISGQIWTDKVEGKVEVRQLLLTTYTIACTCIRQSLKFIRGLRSTTKSNLSSTCSNTTLGFFLTGSCCVQF